MKTIHFVCVGNTYRSRMTEAYFNSLHIPGWQAISSGVRAKQNINGPITPYASRILGKENLLTFTTPSWTQTTQENLSGADYVVFMENSVYETCRDTLKLNVTDFEIWSIEDVDPNTVTQEEIKTITEKTFLDIKTRVNQLVLSLFDK